MEPQRTPESAAEIAALPDICSAACDRHLTCYGRELTPETLVYLLREYQARGDEARFRVCALLLTGLDPATGNIDGGHCEGIIRSLANHFGFRDPELLAEFRSGCFEKMWAAILGARSKARYYEERFGHALKRRAIDVALSLARQRKRERDVQPLPDNEEDEAMGAEGRTQLDDEVLSKIGHDKLLAALRELPPKQSQAALLVWVEGWKVESDDTDEETAATAMGISGRMVRKHLTAARAALSANPTLVAQTEDDRRI